MTHEDYDVLVIGAGPAGAMAALRCATLGASVLLVDKRRFPREKVCGCCINAAALAVLRDAGLGDLPARHGARPLHELRVACGCRTTRLSLPEGVCLSRSILDTALARAAVQAGVTFVDGVAAHIGDVDSDKRIVMLAPQQIIRSGTVVVASGLHGSNSGDRDGEAEIRPGSRIGLSTQIESSCPQFPTGIVHMACGADGYVGLVRLEDDRLDVAAAMAPAFIRQCGGPSSAATNILEYCQMSPPPGLAEARWHGTPPLTRARRTVAAERLVVIGDAAGYVEPFTGEGIAWALASGWAVASLAVQPWRPELAQAWTAKVRSLRRRQMICRQVAAVLRRPFLTRAAIGISSVAPAIAHLLIRRINRPILLDTVPAPA